MHIRFKINNFPIYSLTEIHEKILNIVCLKSLTLLKIEFNESNIINSISIKNGIDFDLDRKKHTFECLPDILTHIAEEEIECFNGEINECSVIYFPQVSYKLLNL